MSREYRRTGRKHGEGLDPLAAEQTKRSEGLGDGGAERTRCSEGLGAFVAERTKRSEGLGRLRGGAISGDSEELGHCSEAGESFAKRNALPAR